MPAVCVIGDPDSHGGSITGGASGTTVHGIPAAYVGASVSPDPIPGHSGKSIVGPGCSGKTLVLGGSKPMVTTGGAVSCGASVTATGSKTTCS